jgi:TolB-like protein/Tfp pilus assembly protein PilF
MQIWSAEIKEIERLYNYIKGQSPELEKELERLIRTDDENIVLVYARRCLEVIITDLCECELKRPRKTEPLQGIIDKLNREEKIPPHIYASMQSLNSLSTFGSHPKDFDPEQVKPVLNNLSTIIKWYLKYKDTQIVSKTKAEETKHDIEKPVVYEEPTGKINKKIIILLSGLFLVGAIVVTLLFVFDVIGGKKQTRELEKSIAVLPFVNDSQDEENTYFINGIMDEVLLNLQAIKDLKVPGRTSVEQYRNPTKSIPEIAKELGVNYIVEGSGQKYGNTFRLRIQLLEGAKGWHLWGESYEQTIERTEDIFDIQNQIAQSIAAELKAIITPEEKQIIEKNLTSNLTAYDFFLRGRDEYIRYKSDNENTGALERAEKFYHQALEYDPTYAQAFTGLAMVYWDKHYWDTYFTSTGNFLDSVLILSDIALSYDDQFAEAYSLKGDYYRENANYNQALEEYEKALNINPNYWQAYAGEGELYFYAREPLKAFESLHMAVKLNHDQELPSSIISLANQYCYSGFFDKARYYYDLALKLNGDSAGYFGNLLVVEMLQENYLKAFEYAERAYAMDTNNVNLFYLLGELYERQSKYRVALKYLEKYVERLEALKIISIRDAHRIGYCYLKNGFNKEAEYYFDLQKKYCEESIKLNRGYASDAGAYYDLAGIYAVKGEKEKAYENLQLFNNKIGEFIIYGWLWYFKNDLLLDSIRNEPQFQEIFREIEAKYKKSYEEIRKWLEEQGML